MSVFHTKTIESILEPVAQQISKLVVLHDDAEDGTEMPDLSLPVHVVQKAADNLIKVGYETCDTSDDLVLKKELPIALKRVEEACYSLQEAAHTLKADPKSPAGKRSLIAGERGILQGVSAILLTFDESEVRKIVQLCKQVLEYLSITELIEKMDDLVTYVKNLTPILTKMTREVDLREKELTHQVHRDLLCQHLDQVKNLTPSFISSVKIYLLTTNSISNSGETKQIRLCIEQNKDFLIKRLSYELNELIRVLQLTTHDEDEWTSDDFTFMKQKLNNFEVKLNTASDWLCDENAVCNGNGEKSVRGAFEDAILIANKLESKQKEQILDNCSTTKGLLNNLCILTQENKRKTSLAKRTAETITNQLISLHNDLKKSIGGAQHYGFSKPAVTTHGKLEQATKWCNNPTFNDNTLGEQSARLILQEAKNLANQQTDSEICEILGNKCHECDFLINHLIKLNKEHKKSSNKNLNDSLNILTVGKQLRDGLNFIVKNMTKSLVQQVADDFLDINHPIRKIADLVNNPSETTNLTEKFNNYSTNFLNHTQKLCNTADQLALSTSQTRNKRNVELINELTKRTVELAPQVVNTAYVVLTFPGNSSCKENFELMQQQWQSNMGRLQKLVDESLDCELFIKACEKSVIRETYQTQAAVQENNHSAIVTNALNIARRSNRILQVSTLEADNSEDRVYVENILYANESLKQSLPPMIQSAKMLALEPSNKQSYLIWASSNEKLIDSISKVRESVSNEDDASDRSSFKSSNFEDQMNLPDIKNLNINEDSNSNFYPMPKYKAIPVSRPTPLPDLVEENETEFPLPQSNQPILMAAHDLHVNINQWYSADNDMISVAKRITHLMARLSELVRGENGTKKDLIATAKQLADESLEICRIAKLLAQDCTDKRMRMNLLQVCESIPTIGTQLKILSTVKATMLGSQASKEDEEATEMLIINAQNLNASVKATVQAAKSASIKIRTDSGLKLRWIRKKSLVNTK